MPSRWRCLHCDAPLSAEDDGNVRRLYCTSCSADVAVRPLPEPRNQTIKGQLSLAEPEDPDPPPVAA